MSNNTQLVAKIRRYDRNLAELSGEHSDAERILQFIVVADVALLGFGNLETTAGLLVTCSLISLFFALAFLFLRRRFEGNCLLYEEHFEGAPKSHSVHRLTDHFDNRSSICGSLTVSTSLLAAVLLFSGLSDQFISDALIPSPPQTISAILISIFVATLLAVWAWLFRQIDKTLDDFDESK